MEPCPSNWIPGLEQGFAEYFRTVTVDGKQADVGRIPTDEYAVLDQNRRRKVADLFRVQQNTKTYNETGDRRRVSVSRPARLMWRPFSPMFTCTHRTIRKQPRRNLRRF
jgi:hypothetical protein